jgi:signal peptidase I
VNRRALGCLLELVETLLLALIVFVVVQLFIAQPYQVQQESMENTLMPDQYILVDKLTPKFDTYHRGDIVVFNPPANWKADATGTPYVKRIIGLPDDTVDIRDGLVYVNGAKLDESYLFDNQPTQLSGGAAIKFPLKLKADQYFVMGDHRQASQDSREFGPITKDSIIGRAWLRYWPFNDFGVIPRGEPVSEPSVSPSASTR